MLMDELQRPMDRRGQATGFVVQVISPGDARVIERVAGWTRRSGDCRHALCGVCAFAETDAGYRTMSWVAAAIAD